MTALAKHPVPLQNQTSPNVTSLILDTVVFVQLAQLALMVKLPPAVAGLRNAFHLAYCPPGICFSVSTTLAWTL